MKAPVRAHTTKRVAFCGTRGLPANYGGFETAVDEISKRFVESDYDCVVYCRESSGDVKLSRYQGRKLAYVKGSSQRSLDTFYSAFQTGWHLLGNREAYDHVFWFNNANFPGILLTLLARIPVSVNTDGMEWRRSKWKWPFKAYYLLASLFISLLCDSVISDSKAMQQFYRRIFLKETHFIPYGVPKTLAVSPNRAAAILDRYGVTAGHYFLQITRFEPDNLPLEVAKAFKAAALENEGFKFVFIGYQHPTPYAQQIKEMSGENGVVVADAVYEAEVLQVLRENCFCYVHGNSVGGTNPALLEAMVSCPRILSVEGRFSREVLGDEGYFFEPDSLSSSLRGILDSTDHLTIMQNRARSCYDWDSVAESYMRVADKQPACYLPALWGEEAGRLAGRKVLSQKRREPTGAPLGVVWICGSHSVVAAGMKSAFEGRARVHIGRSAPIEGIGTSCAIIDTGGVEDLSMVIEHIRGVGPEIPILIFSVGVDLPLVRTALRLGARGFIHGGMELNQIVRAAEVAASGELVVPRKILELLVVNSLLDPEPDPTPRPAITPGNQVLS